MNDDLLSGDVLDEVTSDADFDPDAVESDMFLDDGLVEGEGDDIVGIIASTTDDDDDDLLEEDE
jgi:hypothetical protein